MVYENKEASRQSQTDFWKILYKKIDLRYKTISYLIILTLGIEPMNSDSLK